MAKFSVTLPDGTKAFRESKHDYTHVCAFRITDERGTQPWGAQFSITKKGAENLERKWKTCPAVREGRITVETAIIQFRQ